MSRPLRVRDAAEYLGLSVSTLRGWRQHGTGPASYCLGRTVLYDRDVLDAWVASQKTKTTVGEDPTAA